MEVKTKLKINTKAIQKSKNFKVLICNTKCSKNSFDGKILGLTLSEWVVFACEDIPYKIVDYDKKVNLLEFAKNYTTEDEDYTIILLSSTPLITHETLTQIIEYASFKDINLCKLSVGYVVKNKYLMQASQLMVDSVYAQNAEDFYLVESKAQFVYAQKVLSERINNFHIINGVDIINPQNTYIEPFVDILPNVIIYPNNSLKGKTTIYSGVILKENNVIENSKIGKDSCLSSSIITDTILESNVYVSAFCTISNSIVGHDVTVQKGCSLNGCNVPAMSKINTNEKRGYDDSDSGTGQSGQKL